jgi:uncharacterized protein (UPF0333 family)
MSKVFLILFLISFQVFGQSGLLKGEILDADTKEPIAFATIAIKGKAKGVISNLDGSFSLPERFKIFGDTLGISSMGYDKREVLISEFSNNRITIIYLQPSITELDEAIVKAKKKRLPSARRIVKKAIENIPNNYPIRSFSTVGYYRDYQLDSLGYLNLNEALLEVFDAGFDEIDLLTSKIRIYDYVQNKSFRRDSLAEDPYNYNTRGKVIENANLTSRGGNEFEILRAHDAIRNYQLNAFDFVNNMSKGDILKYHAFYKLGDIKSDGENLFVLRMNRTKEDFTARGKVFISKSDYAIHKFQYTLYDNSKINSDRSLREDGIYGQLLFEVTTEYKRGQGDKMFLNYISFHNRFRLAAPPKFAVKDVIVLPEREAFAVRFNNPLAHVGARFGDDIQRNVGEAKEFEKRWYNFKYKDQRIRFDNIRVVNDSTVYLFPKMDSIPLKTMMRDLASMKGRDLVSDNVLQVRISGLKDVYGNSLDVGEYKDYDQFREFFIQEIRPNATLPTDYPFMDKHKPIFENQPMKKPENFEDYWMNTPLKEKSN